ncbi:unnamed protein product [Cyprideis torosa]|uniref:Band 7 domain-containing protein n=1 Tax=Cyprideis torosa TaxID=163714 RepID=A0A7R8ZP65_9CRUS|nr:unnamed protein product [Cyprideis torosa]CAG0887809.1 unnamed protein product [Cyprideis torosa]
MTWGFETCGPNEALVISGCCYTKPHLVPGGRAFVWPWIQQVQRLSLNTMTLQVESPTVYTSQGVPMSVIGVAQVALETLEGHQRAIMGSMTVEGPPLSGVEGLERVPTNVATTQRSSVKVLQVDFGDGHQEEPT